MVGVEDGAKPALSGNIYLQWKIPCSHGLSGCDQEYDANLILGKAIVTPLSGYSTPRSELSGMVLVSRMALTTAKALQTEYSMLPSGVIMLADYECSISAVETTSMALKPFFHNRVSEVLEN